MVCNAILFTENGSPICSNPYPTCVVSLNRNCCILALVIVDTDSGKNRIKELHLPSAETSIKNKEVEGRRLDMGFPEHNAFGYSHDGVHLYK